MQLTTLFHVHQYNEGKALASLSTPANRAAAKTDFFRLQELRHQEKKITLESGYSTRSGWRGFLKSDTSELLARLVVQTPST